MVDGQLRKMTKILPFISNLVRVLKDFCHATQAVTPNIIHVCLRPGSKPLDSVDHIPGSHIVHLSNQVAFAARLISMGGL